MNDKDGLKACPFCGSKDTRIVCHEKAGTTLGHKNEDIYSIGCFDCGGSVPSRYEIYGRALLIDTWNTRPNPKPDWISVEKFYDKLEASQVELTSEQAEILYSNLFDMYDS